MAQMKDMNGVILVLLVGANESMREELSRMFGSDDGIVVVGKAGSGEEALAKAKMLSIDVILMLAETDMAGMDVIDTTRAINEERLPVRVIIITENVTRHLVPAIKAGAMGVLPRNIGHDELVSAIHRVHVWCHGSL